MKMAQLASSAFIIAVGCVGAKKIYTDYVNSQPKDRKIVDRLGRNCIGDGLKLHEQGEISICFEKVAYGVLLVNLKKMT